MNITIGIPAYNEAANIKKLVQSLLAQKGESFSIKNIIVISDGSSDKTVAEAQSIGDARVQVFEDGQRKGQAARQNEILAKFNEDILVLMNADVLPANEYFLQNLLKPFVQTSRVDIVGVKRTPLPAKGFFERVINFSIALKNDMAENWKNGDNIYLCHGQARAFSKRFARQFRLPKVVSEDAYCYLFCKQNDFRFFYQPSAEIVYRSPRNFKDHVRQSVRFMQGQENLSLFFPRAMVIEEHSIPKSLLIKKFLKYFFINPLLFFSYLVVFMLTAFSTLFTKQARLVWEMAESSKDLN